MDKDKPNKFNNKHLIIVLSILVCAIIALTTAIIIAKVNAPVQEEPVAEEEDEETYDLYWEGMSEDEYQEAQLAELEATLHDQTSQLLNQQPPDIDAVNKIYDSAIATALEQGRKDYIISFTDQRKDDFLAFGLTQAALDAMLTTDFSIFSEPDQYRLYTEVVELAEELNNSTVLEKYKALQKSVEAAYQADYNATAEAAARSNDFDPGPWLESEEEE